MSSLFGVLLGSLVRLVAAVSLGVSAPLLLWALVFYQLWLRCCSGSPISSVVCTGLRLFSQDLRVRGLSVVEVLVMFELWPGPGDEWLNMLYLEIVGWSVSFEMFFLLLVGMREWGSRLWRDKGGRELKQLRCFYPRAVARGVCRFCLHPSLSKTIVILLMFNSANISCRTIVCHPSRW